MNKEIKSVRKKNYMSWDTYFMSIAVLSSFRSKDAHTQNGACVVDCENKVVGIGYNGLPRGLSDDTACYWNDDDLDVTNSRHTYVVHAEKNAIYNSINHDFKGGAIYSKQFPCNVCAQAIIQVGLKKVVYLKTKEHTEEHKKRNNAVKRMFKDADVDFYEFESLNVKDKDWIKKIENMNFEFYID